MITEEELNKALKVNKVLALRRDPATQDDLIGAGNLGIMQSMKTFDRAKGSFATHAHSYILRNQSREYTAICKGIHLPHDIADYADKAAKYSKYELDSFQSFNDTDSKYNILNTDENISDSKITLGDIEGEEYLSEALIMLNESDRKLIDLYFMENLNQEEICLRLKINYSHNKILYRVRRIISTIRYNIVFLSKGEVIFKDKPRFVRRKTKALKRYITSRNPKGFGGKVFHFTNPEGEVVAIKNLKKFCKANKLPYDAMQRVNSGRYKHCQGWKKA